MSVQAAVPMLQSGSIASAAHASLILRACALSAVGWLPETAGCSSWELAMRLEAVQQRACFLFDVLEPSKRTTMVCFCLCMRLRLMLLLLTAWSPIDLFA